MPSQPNKKVKMTPYERHLQQMSFESESPPEVPFRGEFPEFREMIAAGRRFLAGSIHFWEVYDSISRFATVAKFFGASPHLQSMAAEWQMMWNRAWNEWGCLPKDQEITVDELREWVRLQLTVFEEGNFPAQGSSQQGEVTEKKLLFEPSSIANS